MKKILVVLLLVGCTDAAQDKRIGEARYRIYKECMGLAASLPCTEECAPGDVVYSCSMQALGMSRDLGL